MRLNEMPEDYLGFLYRKSNLPKFYIDYWISVPEFKHEMLYLKNKNVFIDRALIFQVMQRIYKEKLEYKELYGETNFKFAPARTALKKLSEILTGSRDNWDKELSK